MGSSHSRRLADLVGRNAISADPELKVALTRLSVEIKERLAQGSPDAEEFFRNTVRELSRIRGNAHAELRVASLFDCGHYFFTVGSPRTAIQTIAPAIPLARHSKLRSWERKCETVLGVSYADSGNVPEAIIHYARALEIARELRDGVAEAIVLLDLGVALNYAGLFREAILYSSRAIQLSSEYSAIRPQLRNLNLNLAQSYLFAEEFEIGLRHVLAAARFVRGTPSDVAEAIGWTLIGMTGVQLAVELHDRTRAKEFRRMAVQAADCRPTTRTRIFSMIADGTFNVHFGDRDDGIATLEKCLSSSEDLPPIRRDVLLALVKAHDTTGNATLARSYIHDLMQDFRKSRQESLATAMSIATELVNPISSREGLSALELRELRLRTQVAEADALNSRIEILERLAITADLREESSGEHGVRVGRLSFLIAESIGMSRRQCSAIELGARLHDIGKTAIPDKILLSSAELKAEERGRMCAHAAAGAEILARSTIPELRLAEEIARFHHEWWNGHGYPTRLSGQRIPLSARIVAIADVFDAMTHGRPYAETLTIDRALHEIEMLSGSQFDPELTKSFLKLMEGHRDRIPEFDNFLTAHARTSPFVQARARIRQLLASSDRGPAVDKRSDAAARV